MGGLRAALVIDDMAPPKEGMLLVGGGATELRQMGNSANLAGATVSMMRPMVARSPSRLRSAAVLSAVFSLAKACSIGLMSEQVRPCSLDG